MPVHDSGVAGLPITLIAWLCASTPPLRAPASSAISAPPHSAHSVDIEPLPGIENIPAPEEDGDTFLANAATKAVYYSRFAPGELVVADDSGLEVDALGGAPGVRSARFAADSGLVDSPDANDNTDVWNNMLLLQRLEGIPPTLRTARYHCTLVVARDGQVVPDRRWHSRRSDSRGAARHRRLRLRSTVLPARTGQDHGRDRP